MEWPVTDHTQMFVYCDLRGAFTLGRQQVEQWAEAARAARSTIDRMPDIAQHSAPRGID